MGVGSRREEEEGEEVAKDEELVAGSGGEFVREITHLELTSKMESALEIRLISGLESLI